LLQQLHIIAFTHRQLEVSKIGLLHIEKEAQALQLAQLKAALGLKELMFLTTCNRDKSLLSTTPTSTPHF
jgi:glutamyl-tRNA reductase